MRPIPDATPILEATAHWRDRCLLADGSVLTEYELWTAANLRQLDRYFVQNLDAGTEDFFSKLEEQLAPASPDAKKLAAEMFWVMYLIVSESAISAETKRYQIRRVWEWSGEDLPEDHPLMGDLLAQGISGTGTAYNTHRWREFRFFITMMEAWKDLDRDRQEALLADPWDFARWIEGRRHASGRQLRHILLFLLFPDHFERIATASHKRTIVRTFRSEWDEDPEAFDYSDRIALDREILRIREEAEERYGNEADVIDFYREPLVSFWRASRKEDAETETTEWPDEEESARWFRQRFGDQRAWLISAGSGGRLWRDFRDEGHVAIGWDYLGDLTEYDAREEIHVAISEQEGRDDPRNDSLAVWQFVREMQPGDVVIAKQGNSRLFGWGKISGEYLYEPDRGEYQHLRPVEWFATGNWDLVGDQRGITTKTLTEFSQYPRFTRWAIERMEGERPTSEDGESETGENYTLAEAVEDLFLDPADFSRILDSLGRRKNVILQGPPGVGKTFMARRLAYALIGRRDPSRVQLVQFHQSYAYEDFIQGWRPNEEGGFVLRDGVFHRFCERAKADSDGLPFVFVIDEINRGNLSRIFGELMMLIESDKRGTEHAIPLTYSDGETFYVPENVHVVGLMNTADRSLAMVDYALRRRFGFLDLEPCFGTSRFTDYLLQQRVPDELVDRINERMGALNAAIHDDRQNLGPGFQIGHSYFVPSGNEETLDESWYEAVIETEVAPLLREYWFDQPERVDRHLDELLA